MGFLLLRMIINFGLIFLLVSSSFLSSSFSGRRIGQFGSKSANEAGEAAYEETGSLQYRERSLRVTTNDYGQYDPAPALGKPPFKLIPN